MQTKLVFLDAASVGDTDLSPIQSLGNLTVYNHTTPEELFERAKDADILITNKVQLMKKELNQLHQLKLICIAATGTNNVDLDEAKRLGIQVQNVANYSTESVAQFTLATAFNLMHHLHAYDDFVKNGSYASGHLFTFLGYPFMELKGKTWGIIGMGNIGKRVAALAKAFDMEVIYYSTSGKNVQAGYPSFTLNEVLGKSDIVSIHAPLNEQTKRLIGYEALCCMKPNACLINVSRGGIVEEKDLAKALAENKIAGAATDVFSREPIETSNPLLSKEISSKLLLTPHIAWSSIESRIRLIEAIANHIRVFKQA